MQCGLSSYVSRQSFYVAGFLLYLKFKITYSVEVLKMCINFESERRPMADPFPRLKENPPVVTNPTVLDSSGKTSY
jgi:hypothetical protein